MNSQSSRLSRRIEKQTKRQIIKYIIAIVILLFALNAFGPKIINFMASITSVFKNERPEHLTSNAGSLEAPLLDDTPYATYSAKIKVSGSSSYEEGTIELYVNNKLQKETELDEKKFEFEHVNLSDGENILKVRYKNEEKESDFSKDYNISYVKDEPKLEVASPVDNATFSTGDQEITVSGKTDPDNRITVNGLIAVVNTDGSFSYYLKLIDGENTIVIEAENVAGRKTKKEIKVKYSP